MCRVSKIDFYWTGSKAPDSTFHGTRYEISTKMIRAGSSGMGPAEDDILEEGHGSTSGA